TRSLTTLAARNAHYRAVKQGMLVRLCRGAYLSAVVWNDMDRHARYRANVIASAELLDQDEPVSHQSAAALWRTPWLGPWPVKAHVTPQWYGGGRSNGFAVRHAWGVPAQAELVGGVRVPTLCRAVVVLARIFSFANAVVVAGAALRR